ncbi:MAG: hypothetical protein ABI317_04845 [Gaiellales bacterium]
MNGQLVRDVRTLLARRQPVLGYLVALAFASTALDLLTAEAADQLSSFSRFSRHEFDQDVLWRVVATLGHGSALAWIAVILAIPLSSALSGWLSACYLIALGDGRYSLRAPTSTIVQLTLLSLIIELISLGLAGLDDSGVAALAFVIAVASTPFTLYAAYAIVFDGVHVLEGVRRSLRMFQLRTRFSIIATLVVLFGVQLAGVAFLRGFHDSPHVQPSYLVAWNLVGILIVFASDAVLLTVYRATRGLSAGGSAETTAAPSSEEPSD